MEGAKSNVAGHCKGHGRTVGIFVTEYQIIKQAMSTLGKRTSPKKTAACRRNGRLGGLAKARNQKRKEKTKMKAGKQSRPFHARITRQMKADLERFAAEDGVQRGFMFSTGGQLRAELVSATTAQHPWLYKTKAGKPFEWSKLGELPASHPCNMNIEAILTEEQETLCGSILARVLKLRRDRDYKDRWQTEWGNKTDLGLFRTVKRIVEEGDSQEKGN